MHRRTYITNPNLIKTLTFLQYCNYCNDALSQIITLLMLVSSKLLVHHSIMLQERFSG